MSFPFIGVMWGNINKLLGGMSFIEGVKDIINELLGGMSFIEVMKDITHELLGHYVLHRGYERQFPRTLGALCPSLRIYS
jgi:ethanolamine transporter EutH